MEFIEEFEKKSTFAKYLLNPFFRQVLQFDPKKPFNSDAEYFELMEARLWFCFLEHELQTNNADSLVLPIGKTLHLNFEQVIEVLSLIKSLDQKVIEIRESKLSVMKLKPRVVRWSQKVGLSEKEALGFTYLVLNQTGNHVRGLEDFQINIPVNFVTYTGMNSHELMGFFRETRKHIKESIFEYFDPHYFLQNTLYIAEEVLVALLNGKMSEEQILKIDKTTLQEVIDEEKTEDKIEVKEKEKEKEKDKTEVKEKIEETDLFEFIKKEMTADKITNKTDENLKDFAERFNKQVKEEKDFGYGDDQTQLTEEVEKDIEKITGQIENVEIVEKIGNVKKVELTEITENGDKMENTEMVDKEENSADLKPYKTDLEYLEDYFEKFTVLIRISNERQNEMQSRIYGGYAQSEVILRQLIAKERVLGKKCERRLELTKKEGEWLPRIERLSEARRLNEFEKEVVLFLVGSNISQSMQNAGAVRDLSVARLIRFFCRTLHEEMEKRKFFYKTGTLIRDGIVRVLGAGFHNNLDDLYLTVDRRMLDFVMGIDTEMSEMVEGSHLYSSQVELDNVILGTEQKQTIVRTVLEYDNFVKCRNKLGLEDVITFSGGIVMLFYGESGTGKTMMANALGNALKKKIMLVNFPTLGQSEAGENIKYIFREAKIYQALLFFDECEALFESREHGKYDVNLLLTEIERFDGIIILATNRAFDLDEGMHRRITIAAEFTKPDALLREKIWRTHLPPSLSLDKDVNIKALASKYELTGGFIKNAVLSALSLALAESESHTNVTLTHKHLEQGAQFQLRSRLRMVDFHRRVVPQRGMDAVVLPKETQDILFEIINAEKARQVLHNWGFDSQCGFQRGTTVLFTGLPGTGKTLAAEAIGFETGKPLKIVNAAEVLSKFVGDTSKNIDSLFHQAAVHDSLLVFDEAEGLFGKRHLDQTNSVDRYANVDVGLLLYHMEQYNGIVILCTNKIDLIDPAFFRRMKYVVDFSLPSPSLREKLWKILIPNAAPCDSDIQFSLLARDFAFAGGNIKNAIFRAASKVALRDEGDRSIHMDDLIKAARDEQRKMEKSKLVY
ncbi:atpase [Anaeramoeba ignava]|uniref:Atpase n=1 Tax=Anaeramoeba ignava TaxID=1746090 RepID=A0A9Q0LE41_ANAIG|nr:atpase [Anaeramoeba ignava]